MNLSEMLLKCISFIVLLCLSGVLAQYRSFYNRGHSYSYNEEETANYVATTTTTEPSTTPELSKVTVESNATENPLDGMGFISYAAEAYNPCKSGIVSMNRLMGLQPEEENYWDGYFNFERYPNLPEANIQLELDHPAVITLNPNEARINSRPGNSFYIHVFDPKKSLKFKVKGGFGKPFPNVKEVILNSKVVCKDPKKWEPYIVGSEGQAAAVPLVPVNDNIPYCGRRKVTHTELVTNGSPTKPGDWPWHVALYAYDNRLLIKKYRCGGSLLSYKVALTAAHCVTNKGMVLAAKRLEITAGKYFLNTTEAVSVSQTVKSVHVHPSHDARAVKSDIALLKFDFISYSDFIQPICLWTANAEKSQIFGQYGTLVGWGLDENNLPSNALTLGEIRIVSDTTCLLSNPTFFERFIRNDTFCAGNGPNNGTSACNGDSGGGLVLPVIQNDNNPTWYLRGIVSLSKATADSLYCDPNIYVIFTDVSKYVDWIVKEGDIVLPN